jgi:hypothetical protein
MTLKIGARSATALPSSSPRIAALTAMPWAAPATMVATMKTVSEPVMIAVVMPIHPPRNTVMPTRWPAAGVNRPPSGAPRTLGAMNAANTNPRTSELRLCS